jgi:hypothetical protein
MAALIALLSGAPGFPQGAVSTLAMKEFKRAFQPSSREQCARSEPGAISV